MTVRGNRTSGGMSGGYGVSSTYDITGFATDGANGNTNTAASPDAKNVVATTTTPSGDATKAMTTGFNPLYQVTSVAGPNGASTSIGYDASARPASTTSPTGVLTAFVYDDVNSGRRRRLTTGG